MPTDVGLCTKSYYWRSQSMPAEYEWKKFRIFINANKEGELVKI